MTYQEQLQDPRWIAVRNKIIDRDFGICQKCMSSRNLNVHHKAYFDNKMAWEYDGIYLITLCNECHEKEHEEKDITEFYNKRDIIGEAFSRIRQSIYAYKQLSKNGEKTN